MNSIDGYFETPWVAIDIEQIVAQLAEFDLRYEIVKSYTYLVKCQSK